MNVAEVIREVSMDLNDQDVGYEYTRWSVDQLQTYLREAIVDVSNKLQDLFLDKVVVKVQVGAGWQAACGCTDIVRILGESTQDGRLLRYIKRSADIEENTWVGSVVGRCRTSPKDYTMLGYTINSNDKSEFRIEPPIPPGVNKYVLIECYQQPEVVTLATTVPTEAIAIIKQWMLYRALSVDSENNPTIIELAGKHRDTFFDLLQMAMAQREKERSEDGSRVRTVQKSTAE